MVTRYCVRAASEVVGLSVKTRLPELAPTVDWTTAPLDTRVIRTVAVENPVMASLKVAVTFRFRPTPVAPESGVVEVICGAGPVVTDQVLVAITLPAASLTPER